VVVHVHHHREADLFHIVDTRRAAGLFFGLLSRWSSSEPDPDPEGRPLRRAGFQGGRRAFRIDMGMTLFGQTFTSPVML
jgi:hypothetical protein